jgi:hypothetical protein
MNSNFAKKYLKSSDLVINFKKKLERTMLVISIKPVGSIFQKKFLTYYIQVTAIRTQLIQAVLA